MKNFILSLIILFLAFHNYGFSQTFEQRKSITKDYNSEKLQTLAKSLKIKAEIEKREAINIAKQKGWAIEKEEDGVFYELMKVSKEGTPIYYTTFNVNAAKSTRANTLNNGGILGLNLDGQNMTAHVWDAGLARSTHQEYDGTGGNDRFSIGDGTTALHYHSAHVTGTIIASGYEANAKGMAPQADAVGYDWDYDISEATTAAANGMLLSNHSYGWGANSIPDWYFGAYLGESREWDIVLYNAPYYLMVVAAGNDGNNNSANGDPLDENSLYDKLSGQSTSKNNMVVANAQDANIDAFGNLVSVSINTGSSQGPTDDYRIKPDIAGNGTSLYSTLESSDNDYGNLTGTSMASPNVCGTLLLLQQHYNNLNSHFMRAATLKGLALHTADDAGPAGPDVVWGWGLLNAKEAANVITNNGVESLIREFALDDGDSYSTDVVSDGAKNLVVSISWTDPPGTANTGTANDNTPALVNDLDVRVTKGASTYYPFKLTSITTNSTGDNLVDPYEKIIISGASGTYTVTVTHKGTLSGGSQKYAMIISGLNDAVAPVAEFSADELYPVNSTNWVKFSDLSFQSPTSWNWTITPATHSFVDGTNSNSQNPTVSFTAPGAYNISLQTTNGYGNNTESKTAYIHVGQRGLWTGSGSTEWNTATNWDNHEIPPSIIDVSITTAAIRWPLKTGNLNIGTDCNNINFGSGSTELSVTGDLIISSGKSLTVDLAGTPTIKVGANWLNNGSFTPGLSTVVFSDGTNGQISGSPIIQTIFYDGFEGTNNWNLSGEFEIDAPAGRGGSHGNADPDNAYAGSKVLGVDLTGIGAGAGDYEASLSDRAYQAVSPTINCTGFTAVTLQFQRWLNVEGNQYDHAYIDVSDDDGSSWNNVWENGSTTIEDDSWNLQTIDISNYTDNKSLVKIRFCIGTTDEGWQYSGWNIDELLVSGSVGRAELFNNLSIDKSNAEVISDGNITVSNDLVLKPTSWFTNAPGNPLSVGNDLTLESSVAGSASFIDNGTTTVTSKTNVQYYCESNLWHYISACFDPAGNHFDDLFTTPVPTEFYRWDESYTDQGITGWWIDVLMHEWGTETFTAGQGYAISDYTKGTTYTLSGDLYNTTQQSPAMTKTTGSSFQGYNLVGNPFPSSMAANVNADGTNNFLTKNSAVLDATNNGIYLYDESYGDYRTVSNASAAAYISRGQGFMVKTKAHNNKVDFNLADRKHGAAPFYKGGDAAQRFFLSITNPENAENETEIVFREGMTNGLDISYDAGKIKGNSQLALYNFLVENTNEEFAIQALPLLIEPVVVPFGFSAAVQGNYSFTTEMQNFEPDTPVTLVDKYTSKQIDLVLNPYYTFVVDAPGTYNDRFLIYFKSAVGIEDNMAVAESDFEIYTIGNQVCISATNSIEKFSVSIFNSIGQLMVQKDFKGNSNERISVAPPGAYIVRVVSEKGVVTKKVIVR
jgi:PKD repeat protein